MGFNQNDSWKIDFPLKSREYGIGKGGCFVSFKNETPVQNIAMVRVLLTSTYWPEHDETEKRHFFTCYWARDKKSTSNSKLVDFTNVKVSRKKHSSKKIIIPKTTNV